MTTAPDIADTPTVPRIDTARRVAHNVKAEMGRHDLTQERLAQVLGLSQQAISDRLRGRTPLTLAQLDVLAVRFGMTVSELIDGRTTPPGTPGSGLSNSDWTSGRIGVLRLTRRMNQTSDHRLDRLAVAA